MLYEGCPKGGLCRFCTLLAVLYQVGLSIARKPRGLFLFGWAMSRQIVEQVDNAMSAKATAASYTVSGVNMLFGLTVNEWCMLIGAICALGTFILNWWYRHQENMRAERLLAQQLRNADRSTSSL